MSLGIIIGYTGAAHVTADDWAALNTGVMGNGDFVFQNGNKLSAAIINANTVRISDGDLTVQGRLGRLDQGTTQDMTIVNGTVGQKRNDLIVARYSKTADIESIVLAVVQGTNHATTPVDPTITTGVLRTGSILHDMPLYRVPLDGLTVGPLVTLFDEAQTQLDTITTYGGTNESGWIKHPGGLIQQWGYYRVVSSALGVVDFTGTIPVALTDQYNAKIEVSSFPEDYASWSNSGGNAYMTSTTQVRILTFDHIPDKIYRFHYMITGY